MYNEITNKIEKQFMEGKTNACVTEIMEGESHLKATVGLLEKFTPGIWWEREGLLLTVCVDYEDWDI